MFPEIFEHSQIVAFFIKMPFSFLSEISLMSRGIYPGPQIMCMKAICKPWSTLLMQMAFHFLKSHSLFCSQIRKGGNVRSESKAGRRASPARLAWLGLGGTFCLGREYLDEALDGDGQPVTAFRKNL